MLNLEAFGEEINILLANEARSLFRHLDEAKPYLNAETFPVWQDLQSVASTGAKHREFYTAMLLSLDLPVRPNTFNQDVAYLHYASLNFLLPLLADEKRQHITSCERLIEYASGDEAIIAQLQNLLAESLADLELLEKHLS